MSLKHIVKCFYFIVLLFMYKFKLNIMIILIQCQLCIMCYLDGAGFFFFEVNWIEMNWIELNQIELNWIEFILPQFLNYFHNNMSTYMFFLVLGHQTANRKPFRCSTSRTAHFHYIHDCITLLWLYNFLFIIFINSTFILSSKQQLEP